MPHGSEVENDRHVVSYRYIEGKTSGEFIFENPGPGKWTFRVHDSDENGRELASVPFEVVKRGKRRASELAELSEAVAQGPEKDVPHKRPRFTSDLTEMDTTDVLELDSAVPLIKTELPGATQAGTSELSASIQVHAAKTEFDPSVGNRLGIDSSDILQPIPPHQFPSSDRDFGCDGANSSGKGSAIPAGLPASIAAWLSQPFPSSAGGAVEVVDTGADASMSGPPASDAERDTVVISEFAVRPGDHSLDPDGPDVYGNLYCERCGRGDRESEMLICDGCDQGYHMYCLVPPLTKIPRGEWRCPHCVAASCSKPTGYAFGFQDANRTYSLTSFENMAHTFKRKYFDEREPTQREIEAEFWRLVTTGGDTNEDVRVLYGADLNSGELGSGFGVPVNPKGKRHKNLLPPTRADVAIEESPWNLNNISVSLLAN